MEGDNKSIPEAMSWVDLLLKPGEKFSPADIPKPVGPSQLNSNSFFMLFENSSDPHFIKDTSFKYIYVNKAMEELLNRPKKEIIGKSDSQFFSDEEAKAMFNATYRSILGKIVQERNVRRIAGIPRTFLDTYVPWRNDFGQIKLVYGVSVDVTDRTDLIATPEVDDSESRSNVMRETLSLAQLVANVNTTALLTGESGSGKDYLARYIHDHSDRTEGPFQPVNCAALPENLLESELFGHEPGAFTGANKRKRGLIELADNGTLFLNEIGELPLALQAKLLSFLDNNPFKRVGGEKDITVDVRIVTATNRDLEQAVLAGTFRSDLYYRMNVFAIRVPPLRHRMEDIPLLTRALIDKITARLKIAPPMTIPSSFVAELGKYHWPGNVRELGSVIEKALVFSTTRGGELDSHCVHLPNARKECPEPVGKGDGPKPGEDDAKFVQPVGNSQPPDVNKSSSKRPEKPSDEELWRLYRVYIEGQGWKRAKLARELGWDPSTLKKWLKAAGCPAGTRGRPRKSAPPKPEESTEPSSEPSTE